MAKNRKLDDVDIYINSGNPTDEDFKEISKAIQAYKKKVALREKKRKAANASTTLKKKSL
jgi:hypothetical protein